MLRTRIFLNVIPASVILIAVSAYALFLFSRLAKTVDRTITVNYYSDAAAEQMMIAVDRMDKALDRSRKEERSSIRPMFDDNRRNFEEKLQSQLTNTAVIFELPEVLQLQTNLAALQRVGSQMFDPDVSRTDQDKKYNESMVITAGLKQSLTSIRREISKSIIAEGDAIQRITRRITGLLILGLIVAVLISFYTSFKLGKAILKPIQTLTNAAREIGEGKLDLIVPVLSQDELGELATTFNKMAAQLSDYRQGTNEQIVRLHHTMEAALASFTDPVFILDTDGHIELKNRAAQELSMHLSIEGALPPKLAAAAADVIQNAQDFLPDSFAEVLTLRVNGDEKSFLPRIHLMRDSDTHPIGAAVVLHDVTRFRLLDDAKTNLVATVSHEIKTPLTSVRMVLHMLLEKSLGPLTKPQSDAIRTARKDSERLLKILDALLDIARLEAGASAPAKEPVAPAKLLESIVREADRNAKAHGLTITSSVEPGLPAVLVDQQQIKHVFHNYIINAIKHSPTGAEIQINAAPADNGNVQFSVHDHGPGIPEEYQGVIFDRFVRVPNQPKTGAGLGLSIAREIVVAHGGRVGVRSEPGQGSEFFFVLEGAEEKV